jgi:phosphatidylserine decarboxylase
MITPYGYDNAFLMLAVAVALVVLSFTVPYVWLAAVLGALGVVLAAFTLWFFRDPERPLLDAAKTNPAIIVAPADGAVTEVVPITHLRAFNGPATQITIFLSPVNLHVNRYPATGTIRSVQYFPGKYLMAFNPKASEENERSEVVLDTAAGPVLFRQITGFLARRIVYTCVGGTAVTAGERFGMMKFGSRMDVLVPPSAAVHVNVGDKVVSARTALATLAGSPA